MKNLDCILIKPNKDLEIGAEGVNILFCIFKNSEAYFTSPTLIPHHSKE